MYAHMPRAVLVAITVAAAAHAAPPWVTQHRRGDVIVATVKKVSEHDATNGNPPTVELEIHEVLRGEAKTDRTRAVWQPQPLWNGECPVGVDVKKMTQNWEAKKLASPKAGDKFVLWGEMTGDAKKPVFGVFTWEAYPFSEEKQKWAVKVIKDIEEETRLQEEKRVAEKKAKEKALADWRAKVTDDDLKKYAAEADFVLVGRLSSWGNSDGYGLTLYGNILKGENLPKSGSDSFTESYYLRLATVFGPMCYPPKNKGFAMVFPLPAEVRARLDWETDYLLFVTLKGAKAEPSVICYPPIKTGEGIVIADRKALGVVKEALGKK